MLPAQREQRRQNAYDATRRYILSKLHVRMCFLCDIELEQPRSGRVCLDEEVFGEKDVGERRKQFRLANIGRLLFDP